MTDELKALADLLPCPNPWCKSAQSPKPYYRGGGVEQVICGCGTQGPPGDDRASAITAWNTRKATCKEILQVRDNLPASMTDTQNSADPVGEIEAIISFAAMHHCSTTGADAELAAMRARITALEAHIAAEPDRMREVVEAWDTFKRGFLAGHGGWPSASIESMQRLNKLLPAIRA